MAKLAFLGLGAMGAPMAARLIAAGHEVAVWNRTPSRAQAVSGAARVAESPADAARGADAVITMLENPQAVSEVLLGDDGVAAGAGPGATLIEMSTIGPDALAEIRERLPEGVELVDAPVLGSVSNAEDGSLDVFVGASEEAFERWRDVLSALGTPMHLGPPGSGAAMKLVANSTLAGVITVAGEALALADGFGLDQQRALEALLKTPIGPGIRRKLDKIESDRYDPSFRLALMLKDMRLVLDAAQRRQVELRVADAAARWVQQAGEHGLGDCDYSAVVAEIRGRDATC
jgi:3-hydroxyisobutyrate dehydrogenase/2-hydroxy-3-oxopropionate reductase